MESSRIFVNGLPPSLSAEDFRQHFSKQSAITDAKFIPHRRIGYVGYKTPEDAAKAVKYHNKSFIRMSKISVELARSVEDQLALGFGVSSVNGTKRKHADFQEHGQRDISGDEKTKRERKRPAEPSGTFKLRESLDVMQPPFKSKIRENEDVQLSQRPELNDPRTEAASSRAGRSGYNPEQVPLKRKKEQQIREKFKLPSEPPAPAHASGENARTNSIDGYPSSKDTQEPSIELPTLSDADWLRSRTSRLFGLPGGDHVQNAALLEDSSTGKAGLPELPELVKGGSVSDSDVQTQDELEVEGPEVEIEPSANGRLFVRNLAYTITEEDLRKYFEDQHLGSVEEVSSRATDSILFQSNSGDEYPDRDSLCNACDVTRKNILVDNS